MNNAAYDEQHRRERADWAILIEEGHRPICHRCSKPIEPGQLFDLGHRQDLKLGGNKRNRSPEHQYCNRSAGQAISINTPPSRYW